MNPFLRRVAALLLLPTLAHAYGYTATDGLGVMLLTGLAFWLLLLGLVVTSFRRPQARWLLFWQVPTVVFLSAYLLVYADAGGGPPSQGSVLLLLFSLYLTGRTLSRQRHLPPRRIAGLLAVLVGSGVVLAAFFN